MPQHAGDHDLMHRIDHRRRRACPDERVAHVDHVGQAGTLAAELAGNHDPKQSLRPDSHDCLFGKACVAIDPRGVRCGDRGSGFRASLEVSRHRNALRAIVGSDLKRERVFTAGLQTAHWLPLLAILTIKASIVEMERKFAGVMSDAGIVMPNSASTAIIRLTMSSEVRPASLSWSSIDGARLIELFDSICMTSSINRSLGRPVPPPGISSFPESSDACTKARALIAIGCSPARRYRQARSRRASRISGWFRAPRTLPPPPRRGLRP